MKEQQGNVFCSVDNLNEKVFKSQIFLFNFKACAALHIGECCVVSKFGRNFALHVFSLLYICGRLKKKQQPRNKTAWYMSEVFPQLSKS